MTFVRERVWAARGRAALIGRYENPNTRHLLAQIAGDGSQKIAIRIVPALKAEAAAGGDPSGAARAIAALVTEQARELESLAR